jgi:hypothetical protein
LASPFWEYENAEILKSTTHPPEESCITLAHTFEGNKGDFSIGKFFKGSLTQFIMLLSSSLVYEPTLPWPPTL